MNRLIVRLVLSHLLVAVVGGVATFLVVRTVAPGQWTQHPGFGRGGPGGGGTGPAALQAFVDSVDRALVAGVLVGVAAATLLGALSAYRLTRPIEHLREGTRRLATGSYGEHVPVPHEHELAALAHDVNTLGEALAETEQRRTRLLGEVAHEMRNPLAVVDGTVEAMIDGVLPADPEQLGLVSEQVRRLGRLADDLSALSRAQEGRLDLELEVADLREALTAAVERHRAVAAAAGVELRLEAGERALPAAHDAGRIAQVLDNLIGNAVRATPEGGTVTVRGGRHQGQAVLQVSDTGEGLDPAEVERVFERFYRVPGSRRGGAANGSGIGLTIARDLVRAHGGELDAQSPGRGHGAEFTARLPLRGGGAQSVLSSST